MAIFSISLLVYPISFVSFSVSLCQVFRGLPLRLFPGGFHVMVFGGFLSVCPIHLHFLFFISFSMGSCLVIFQSVVLDSLSVHFRCRILTRHLLMKVCILFSVFCVLRHVSDPKSKTALTFKLNILSLVLVLICFALQIFSQHDECNSCFLYPCFDVFCCASMFVDCTAQVCE